MSDSPIFANMKQFRSFKELNHASDKAGECGGFVRRLRYV